MRSDIIIQVEGLGKKYTIRHERPRYTALRDVIVEKASGFFKKLKRGNTEKPKSRNGSEDFRISDFDI